MKVFGRTFVVLIVLIIAVSGCKAPENRVTPPFYTITDEETGGKVYLVGTMHVGVENTVYPDEIYAAIDECGTLAVELDLLALESDAEELSAAMSLLECESAEDFLGDDYAEIKSFFVKKKIYNANYDRYIPAVWSSALSSKIAADCGYYTDYGTDRALISYAKKNGVAIYELESAAEQYQINANEGKELQCYSLKSAVEADYEDQQNEMRELYSAWSTANSEELKRMIAESCVPDELSEQYAEYYAEMYENRQRKMADYALETLKSGNKAVIAVGAMHLYATPDIRQLIIDGLM